MVEHLQIKKTSVFALLVIGLFVFLCFSVLIAVTFGSTDISFSKVYEVIMANLPFAQDDSALTSGATHDIVMLVRLPRLILAVAVGMGLAVCGVVMQAIVKNPLADPYVLGVSSGASLGATLSVMLGVGASFGSNSIGVMGCVGAFAASMLVLALSNVGGPSNSVKLLLSGMAISAISSAFSSFIIYFANNKEGMMNITFWLMGSLASAKWSSIVIILPLILLCSLFFLTQYRILNLMLLGDEVSITLGTDLTKYRNFYLLVCSIMVGFIVYASGMIGFVGLIIPHVSRILVGTNHKRLLPVSMLMGALLLVWADVLCRIVISGTELPIGVLISMIGAPAFIYLMINKSYGFGGK